MFGLTPLGLLHTAISLIAVVAGLILLVRDHGISPRRPLGRLYVVTTVITCVTGFGIFQHGGFGKPHALGILTLVVLAVAALAERGRGFGRASPYVETVAYSATLFFHLIPGFTETLTRLPPAAPVFASPEAPGLQALAAVLLVLFTVGAYAQVRRLRAAAGTPPLRR
ncbi:putative membrane protein [Plasticicumulans lactativorans]|uniref:Putative membrane protein n=1 Tax=Plasticicumulans lactativorans TaxID=1133106 RepID=A0A4R2L5I8_9GAMM|nr:hypothetical protein [Plasticicumulans lactativorans]TCO80537.1 putative membrane protein [Plasticicumulans lactativorans]